MRIRRTAALAAMALILALGSATQARAQAASVSMGDNFYDPATVTISVGDTVTWSNDGQAPHTATDPGNFDSGIMNTGDTFSHTFSSAGTFSYFCTVHGEAMSGTVIVQAPGEPIPSPTGELPPTGPAPGTALLAILGGALLLGGAGVLFALRRRA